VTKVELFPLFILAGIAIRFACHFWDKSRIRSTIEAAGGTVYEIKWRPFARGWFGEKGERHYEVRYRTVDGRTLTTTCKTSLFTGVYWSGDSIPNRGSSGYEIPIPPPPPPLEETQQTQSGRRATCQFCGHPAQADWSHCPKCGAKL
jgi:hypothetical protein